jgi:hypothetical protein
MKSKIGMFGIGMMAVMLGSGGSAPMAGAAEPAEAEAAQKAKKSPAPFCVVTERSWIVSPYSDPSEEVVTQQRIEMKWVSGGSPQKTFGLAEADLPYGGKASLRLRPGYGLIFQTLRIEAADGRSADAGTVMPWYPLTTGAAHTDVMLQYASVSTGLELLLPGTSRGRAQYRTIRKSSVECQFNPLMVKERS